MNFEEILGKSQKEEKSSSSGDLDFDSLLKLASSLTNQDTLFDKLSKSNVTNESNGVDFSNIVEKISAATPQTFSGLEDELNEIKTELKKLNENIEALLKKE
ncbi:hypothetical protein SAMN04487936_103355 [Halobacillus dabanensis]|uniref:Uncharacterized protein n=1 Tax=Halobacillus dabanensis TaxID=240302 RepID=A0A1I3TFR2_HALDA|nr:hypothetical protein [Halobacillus dabanensis]SFJ69362.1 hypothetical protein SAMN04487936_103355 [Halobacillus dabanensis]